MKLCSCYATHPGLVLCTGNAICALTSKCLPYIWKQPGQAARQGPLTRASVLSHVDITDVARSRQPRPMSWVNKRHVTGHRPPVRQTCPCQCAYNMRCDPSANSLCARLQTTTPISASSSQLPTRPSSTHYILEQAVTGAECVTLAIPSAFPDCRHKTTPLQGLRI